MEVTWSPKLGFTLRRLLWLVAMFALVSLIAVWVRNQHYSERREINAALAQIQGLSNVRLRTHQEGTEQVDSVAVSLAGKPDSVIEFGNLHALEPSGTFFVSRIGPWTFSVSGKRHLGVVDAMSGKSIESDYLSGHIPFGPTSPYADMFPFDVSSPQSLVDHYDEVLDALSSWPREDSPGSVKLVDGTTQWFFVEKATDESE
ncbi:MAG: hypothetical protein KDA83_09990 [Planctomycetales bacterium]|nr:hypothetical protein [Planctomycetales bacterium]